MKTSLIVLRMLNSGKQVMIWSTVVTLVVLFGLVSYSISQSA